MNKKFVISIQGKQFVKFEGLLDAFHNNGGTSIKTYELKSSTPERPIFKAIVKGKKGTFTGHGDAENTNVNKMIAPHKYRMAETRAIARALRWYLNIGMCAVEEVAKPVPQTKVVDLPEKYVKQLNAVSDLLTLNTLAKKIQTETKHKYQKSLLNIYNQRKEELK